MNEKLEQENNAQTQAASAEAPKPHKRPLSLLTALAVAAALLLAAGGSTWEYFRHQHSAAHAAYSVAVSEQKEATAALAEAMKVGEKTLKAAEGKNVDSALVEALKTTLEETKKLTTTGNEAEPSSTHALREATAALRERAAQTKDATARLEVASKAVNEALVEGAKSHLTEIISGAEAAIADATQALTDSENKVADNQVRADLEAAKNALQQQVDQAKTLTTTEAATLEEASKTLDEAVKVFATQIQAVKDAHEAWEKAQNTPANTGSVSAVSNGRRTGGGNTPARNTGNTGNTSSASNSGNTSNTGNAGNGGWVDTTPEGHSCWVGDAHGNSRWVPCN